jgi:hypothetical protein
MDNKKPYSPPQLFRIELNQEQAILSACSMATTSASQGGTGGCRPNNCKKRNGAGGSDAGARPS